jgi:hypothetical protein
VTAATGPAGPASPRDTARDPRAARLRAPLLLALWTLLAFEAAGGTVIFVARLAAGRSPGEAAHVIAGVALTALYAGYQWTHWQRVKPFRPRLDYAIGLLASLFTAFTNLTGLALAWAWWRHRVVLRLGGEVDYPPLLSAVHNIGSMLVLTFVLGHLAAVLMRDHRARSRPSGG